ncbi:helix-turn-helix domain-containing protein [Herbidospora sp. NEAU-GS84]|uniref:Helix-turn-helix domain-containing protein n=1 Tax=Herbidospora solisilvae TaxID=2696284 RepID=A0A7C9MWR2_9ACTN|nr:helix-turn-helix domain-containing protein [Herbidospora solisilvae]
MERRRQRLLKPGVVAKIFDVRPRTVIEWVRTGKLRGFQTPGGQHYRVCQSAVEALLRMDRPEVEALLRMDSPGKKAGLPDART